MDPLGLEDVGKPLHLKETARVVKTEGIYELRSKRLQGYNYRGFYWAYYIGHEGGYKEFRSKLIWGLRRGLMSRFSAFSGCKLRNPIDPHQRLAVTEP